jgi:hypothetical protein
VFCSWRISDPISNLQTHLSQLISGLATRLSDAYGQNVSAKASPRKIMGFAYRFPMRKAYSATVSGLPAVGNPRRVKM